MRIDNRGEFYGKEFNQVCRHHGIARQNNTPYTPQQNGVAERMNITLMEKDRNMLSDAGLQQYYWDEGVDTTCYLVNRLSMLSLVDKTPYEAGAGKMTSLAHLRVCGLKQ